MATKKILSEICAMLESDMKAEKMGEIEKSRFVGINDISSIVVKIKNKVFQITVDTVNQ